jgi:hypothetical protein
MYIIKLTRSTIAYKPFVCPLFSESITVKIERTSRTIDFMLKPRIRGKSIIVQTTTTVGILSPILANAEPRARLMLVWYWPRLAARIAAMPSGNKITAAIATPTNAVGKPAATIPLSITGERFLARKITTPKHKSKKPRLVSASLPVTSFSSPDTSARKYLRCLIILPDNWTAT